MYIVLHEKKWHKQISPYNFWKKCIFKNSSHGFEVIIVRKIPILRKYKLPSRLWIQNPCLVEHLSFYFKQSNHELAFFSRKLNELSEYIAHQHKKASSPFYHKNIFDRKWM